MEYTLYSNIEVHLDIRLFTGYFFVSIHLSMMVKIVVPVYITISQKDYSSLFPVSVIFTILIGFRNLYLSFIFMTSEVLLNSCRFEVLKQI